MEITNENEKIEFDLLLQAIYQKYGYDFRNYARASLKRRIRYRLSQSNFKTILLALPSSFALSVIIVMHRHKDTDGYLELSLDNECKMSVKQADEKEEIRGGVVYVAPPSYHLLIEDNGTFSMSVEGVVNYARPSVDVVFESAADVYGQRLIGIILTGANIDGSQGLRRIKEAGGLTIVQSPETSEVADMPEAAIAAVKPDYVLSLENIGSFLRKLESEG